MPQFAARGLLKHLPETAAGPTDSVSTGPDATSYHNWHLCRSCHSRFRRERFPWRFLSSHRLRAAADHQESVHWFGQSFCSYSQRVPPSKTPWRGQGDTIPSDMAGHPNHPPLTRMGSAQPYAHASGHWSLTSKASGCITDSGSSERSQRASRDPTVRAVGSHSSSDCPLRHQVTIDSRHGAAVCTPALGIAMLLMLVESVGYL